MSKTHKVSIVLALVVLTALGLNLIRRWPPLASASGQEQPPESDTLFFVSGSQPSIQHVSVSKPRRLVDIAASVAVESIPINTALCDVAGLHPSPNGRWIAVDVGCEANVHTLVLEIATGRIRPIATEFRGTSLFLNWDPGGDTFLLRVGHLGEGEVLLVNTQDGRVERMDIPPYTYDAVFSPDGEWVLYAVTRGLGFGSEVWLMGRNGRTRKQVIHDPAHIVAYPRWSPDGSAIAYIRMADSNVPFTVGELVLADGNGRNGQVLAPADAGHGCPPVWSPNGQRVAFVVRENPEDRAANVVTSYLENNIW